MAEKPLERKRRIRNRLIPQATKLYRRSTVVHELTQELEWALRYINPQSLALPGCNCHGENEPWSVHNNCILDEL